MSDAGLAISAIEKLRVPQGRLAGQHVRLGGYQKQFIEGWLADGVSLGVLSVARGNAKTSTAAALAVTHAVGMWGAQPQREVLIAARVKDQAAIAFNFCRTYLDSLDDELRTFEKITVRTHPHFSLTLHSADGPHEIRAISADGKSALGGGPTLVIADERAAWREGRGDELESSLITSLGKRDGRMMIISTSGRNDANAFSQWCDRPPEGCYVQEHRPPPGLPADDLESLLIANPGTVDGIGATQEFLLSQIRQAQQFGGGKLALARNLLRNERVDAEGRDVLVPLDDWLECEKADPPPRSGGCIIGLDLGGPAAMTSSAFFWPETGRLECLGWFPSMPDLLVRGERDHVGDRYSEMARLGELRTAGNRVVPEPQWIAETLAHIDEPPVCIVGDRFKVGDVADALDLHGVGGRMIWRGNGFRDGSEDVRRFQRAVVDRWISAPQTLLLRSALADCSVAVDEAGNEKLSKRRSTGRIDPVQAAVLAVAEGSRRRGRPEPRGGTVRII